MLNVVDVLTSWPECVLWIRSRKLANSCVVIAECRVRLRSENRSCWISRVGGGLGATYMPSRPSSADLELMSRNVDCESEKK